MKRMKIQVGLCQWKKALNTNHILEAGTLYNGLIKILESRIPYVALCSNSF